MLPITFALCLAATPDNAGATEVDRRAAPPIRGVVRAVHHVTLSTEAPLLALRVPFREGHRFARGDLLVEFDCRRQKADRDAAGAAHREATLNLESGLHLDRYKAVGKNDVEIARARVDRAKAELDGHRARLDECRFIAPFDGRIVEVALKPFERAQPQRPYLSIIDDQQLEIETIVPSDMLAVLAHGTAFSFRLDELAGHVVQAQVSSIAAVVDPVSKTVKVIGIFAVPVPGILAGMSGTAQFAWSHMR